MRSTSWSQPDANCGANARRGGRWKTIRISVARASNALPARMKKGTPDQRQLSMSRRREAKVSVWESGFTPGTSR